MIPSPRFIFLLSYICSSLHGNMIGNQTSYRDRLRPTKSLGLVNIKECVVRIKSHVSLQEDCAKPQRAGKLTWNYQDGQR